MISYGVQIGIGVQPGGDQPSAIAKLVAGIEAGLRHQTLFGGIDPVRELK